MRRDPLDNALLATAVISLLVLVLRIAGWRALAFDEIEFTRATDWVAHGQIPFRDFWEHHTPLQWYLFAPVKALFGGPGAATVLWLRVAQVPVWIAALWLLWRWTASTGISSRARAVAFVTLFAAGAFGAPAVEYRVDVAGCCALVLAWCLLEHATVERTRSLWIFAAGGSLLVITALLNMRFAPLAAAVGLVLLATDRVARRWRLPRPGAALAVAAGAGAIVLAYAAYLFVTHSANAFWNCVAGQNAAMGTIMQVAAARTALRVLALPLRELDVAGVVLIVGACIGAAAALRRTRRPGPLEALAIVQVVSVIVLLRMPVLYPYHLIVVLVFAVPLLALALDELQGRATAVVIALVAVAALLGLWRTIYHGRTHLEHQDSVMREVDARTPPGSRVFDGVGFALRRPPAYRYWFLPLGVDVLVRAGHVPRYEPQLAPPAAMVFDRRVVSFFLQWADVREYFVRHYVPVRRELWLPGMNALLPPHGGASWRAPVDGRYRVVAAPELADHLWFQAPIAVTTVVTPGTEDMPIDLARVGSSETLVAVDPLLDSHGLLTLRGGELVRVVSKSARPLGVFVVPADIRVLFQPSAENGTIDEPLMELF
jgi:hypothetical protein